MKPRAKIFRFCGYNFDTEALTITFDYQIEFSNRKSLDFTETILLPRAPKYFSHELLQKFLEPLHLILGISYYKLYCPPKIYTPFRLSKKQAVFWNTVYRSGLGEFLYRNRLEPKRIAKFPYSKTNVYPIALQRHEDVLLGVGGGKDSIVAAELLKGFMITSFLVETQRRDPIAENIIKKIGNPAIIIERTLDPKIFQPHEGSYNGHIPISAIFAFVGLLSAALYGCKYVIVGNEQSSNVGNIKYRGDNINHQWSKSAEFEALLQDYTRKFITRDIIYFSLLRQFSEIRITKMFARHQKYFPIFTSCNKNFTVFKKRADMLWCGTCPKCAFVFLMLAPFLSKKKLCSIFQKNLLADKKLIPLFRDILGFGTLKPFDCVGTFEESQAALFLASKNFKNEIVTMTFLPKIMHPQKIVRQVFKTTFAPTLPTPFRFLGITSVCIVGYGKEGRTTKKYIRKYYPALKIGILDQGFDKNYLTQQEQYDLAIKTPGIQRSKLTIPYTTATNIFFSQNKNFTIGVTGSKGKSTTASLIYEILKAAGKKVRLVGNIGNPMLGVCLTKIDPHEIFVIELSSYMLEDIAYSPHIAVLLNLFPEHINYHDGIKNYYKAKENIFTFQRPGDYKIKAPFIEKIPLAQSEIPLLGPHNLQNIKAAIKVARLLNVSNTAIRKAIKNFKPLPHRLEFIGVFNGITFYDDAISTTPESTIMAITSLKNVDTIFLGGEDRGYDFRNLEKHLRSSAIKNIVLFPDSGERMLTSRHGFHILKTRSMKKAVAFAYKNTAPGKVCLLSTASPSYSLWKNFEEKGRKFKKYVHAAHAHST